MDKLAVCKECDSLYLTTATTPECAACGERTKAVSVDEIRGFEEKVEEKAEEIVEEKLRELGRNIDSRV